MYNHRPQESSLSFLQNRTDYGLHAVYTYKYKHCAMLVIDKLLICQGAGNGIQCCT